MRMQPVYLHQISVVTRVPVVNADMGPSSVTALLWWGENGYSSEAKLWKNSHWVQSISTPVHGTRTWRGYGRTKCRVSGHFVHGMTAAKPRRRPFLPSSLRGAGLAGAGVEHLLRNVKDATVSTLSTEVSRMATGLRGLQVRLAEIQAYLSLVLERKIPVNHDIIYQLQVHMPPHDERRLGGVTVPSCASASSS